MKQIPSFSLLLTGAAVLGTVCLARSEWERSHFVCTYYDISRPNLPDALDGYRLVFFSDLHNQVFGKNNQPLIDAVDAFSPHLVLFGGDSMTIKSNKKMDFSVVHDLVNTLAKKYPVVYSNGNHEQRMRDAADYYPDWYQTFRDGLSCHVTYLENDTCCIPVADSNLYIASLELDEAYYQHRFGKLPLQPNYLTQHLGNSFSDGYTILLAHSPLYLEEYAAWGANLTLSGHFHGGTIRLPFLGGVMTPQFQFFCGRDRGRIEIGDTTCIISAGLGTHSVNVRFNNRPELVCITLHVG